MPQTSNCCNSPMTVDGHTTKHYECTKCKKPCDPMPNTELRKQTVQVVFTKDLRGKVEELVWRSTKAWNGNPEDTYAISITEATDRIMALITPHQEKTPPTAEVRDWKKEFDEQFPELNSYVWNVDQWITTSKKDAVKQFISDLLASERKKAMVDGANTMWDWMVLTGTTIDGVDYIKLDDIEIRAKECIDSLSPTNKEK